MDTKTTNSAARDAGHVLTMCAEAALRARAPMKTNITHQQLDMLATAREWGYTIPTGPDKTTSSLVNRGLLKKSREIRYGSTVYRPTPAGDLLLRSRSKTVKRLGVPRACAFSEAENNREMAK